MSTLCGCTGEYRPQDLELRGRRAPKRNAEVEPECRICDQMLLRVSLMQDNIAMDDGCHDRQKGLSSFNFQSAPRQLLYSDYAVNRLAIPVLFLTVLIVAAPCS
jgi:hypothetical protein